MRKIIFSTTLTLSSILFLGACSGTTEHILANPYKMQKSCESLNRSLMKIDEYIAVVENSSAFHLEEAAVAYEIPGVTISNNKRHMLRDAKLYREQLNAKYINMKCPKREKK